MIRNKLEDYTEHLIDIIRDLRHNYLDTYQYEIVLKDIREILEDSEDE